MHRSMHFPSALFPIGLFETAELRAALEEYLFEFEIVQSVPPVGMPS